MLRMMFPPVLQRSSVRCVALGNSKANAILRFYSTVETVRHGVLQVRHESSSTARAGQNKGGQRGVPGGIRAHPRPISAGSSEVEQHQSQVFRSSPQSPFFNRSLTIPGEIINQLESSKIGAGWCQTSSSHVNR